MKTRRENEIQENILKCVFPLTGMFSLLSVWMAWEVCEWLSRRSVPATEARSVPGHS